MQVTIDSTEPLERVLPVVSALYGVELTIANDSGAGSPAPTRGGTTRSASRSRTKPPSEAPAATRRRSGRGPRPDAGTVRSWARANGHDVRDRGRVPTAIIDAFLADAAPAR